MQTTPQKYSISDYQISKELLISLSKLDEKRSHVALVLNWIFLILIIYILKNLPNQYLYLCYVPGAFLIASRYALFLQLIHEGSHGLLSQSKKINHFIVTYLCSLPLGIQFEGYQRGHSRHHAFTNTEKDPKSDTEKYRITDFSDPKIYLLFLKDLLGITAFQVFFQYDEYDREADQAKGTTGVTHKIGKLLQLGLVQMIVLGAIFQFSITDYILFWIIPAISAHMFLMRIRGIAEHGLPRQLGITNFGDGALGNFYTRSFMTSKNSYQWAIFNWLEKFMIGSLSVHYHHEHHLVPYVPFYHLKKLHLAIADQVVEKNPDVYAKGYLAAMLRNIHLGRRLNGLNQNLIHST